MVQDVTPLQSGHLGKSVRQVKWGVLGAVSQGTNFNGVVVGVQSLSKQVIRDF